MQLTHYLSVAVLLAFVPFPAAQDGKKPDDGKPKAAAKPSENQRIQRDLLGSWTLTRAETNGETYADASCRGVMIVAEDCLSITAQLESTNSFRDAGRERFSSAAYRWKFDEDRLLLITTTMVSVDNFAPGDLVEYEPSGVKREYRFNLSGDSLTLTREGGGKLVFTRLAKPKPDDLPPIKR